MPAPITPTLSNVLISLYFSNVCGRRGVAATDRSQFAAATTVTATSSFPIPIGSSGSRDGLAISAVAPSDFEQPRRAHAAADAHRHHDIFDAASLAFNQRIDDPARAAHPVGVTDQNRAAVAERLRTDAT